MPNDNQQINPNASQGQDEPILSLVGRSEAAIKRLEEKERAVAESIKKLEELEARRIVSGKSDAGVQSVPVKEETPLEYAKRISNTAGIRGQPVS